MKILKSKLGLLVLPILAAITLSSCTTYVNGPNMNTCYVRDLMGRSWHWTSAGNACGGALQACQNWHVNHGIYNGRCMIQ